MKSILLIPVFIFTIIILWSCNTEEQITANNHLYKKKDRDKLIGKQKEITNLIIANYKDSIFPNDLISKFDNLNEIDIYTSSQKVLIDTSKLFKLKKLKSIFFLFVTLDSFPTAFCYFDSLTSLKLPFCNLKNVSSEISRLKYLKTIDLSGNYLTSLPEFFSKLSNLQTLSLTNNQFKNIPMVLKDIPNIEIIDLGNREGEKETGINENDFDFMKETSLLSEILKINSLKKLYITIYDCETTKSSITKLIALKSSQKKL